MLVINPAYGFFFSQMDLKVGEKMNFFGAGIIKVIGKQKIAGREGFVCQLFQADEEEKMIAEWVIDPDLALPLRSKIFDDNELQGQIELVKYIQY
jgi:ATP-dependent RNA circularization protein (DNA/RNA ligase family)